MGNPRFYSNSCDIIENNFMRTPKYKKNYNSISFLVSFFENNKKGVRSKKNICYLYSSTITKNCSFFFIKSEIYTDIHKIP